MEAFRLLKHHQEYVMNLFFFAKYYYLRYLNKRKVSMNLSECKLLIWTELDQQNRTNFKTINKEGFDFIQPNIIT